MTQRPPMQLSGIVLDSTDPDAHASFYERLLGWPRTQEDPTWVKLVPSPGAAGLSFQLEPLHVAPVWPTTSTDPQMQVHLDLLVEDLEDAAAFALECGAALADAQFDPENVRVFLDPMGHPFCLFIR